MRVDSLEAGLLNNGNNAMAIGPKIKKIKLVKVWAIRANIIPDSLSIP